MTDEELIAQLRDGCSCNIDSTPCCSESECRDALAAADRIEELEAENLLLKTAGIIEVAAHNNRVTEYMFHWEGRALDAEAKLAKAVEAGQTMDDGCDCERCSKARATLAELKGVSYD